MSLARLWDLVIVISRYTQQTRASAGCVKSGSRDVDQAMNVIRSSDRKNKFSSQKQLKTLHL